MMAEQGKNASELAHSLLSRLLTDDDLRPFYEAMKIFDVSSARVVSNVGPKRKSQYLGGLDTQQYGRGKRAREVRSYEEQWTEEEFERMCQADSPESPKPKEEVVEKSLPAIAIGSIMVAAKMEPPATSMLPPQVSMEVPMQQSKDVMPPTNVTPPSKRGRGRPRRVTVDISPTAAVPTPSGVGATNLTSQIGAVPCIPMASASVSLPTFTALAAVGGAINQFGVLSAPSSQSAPSLPTVVSAYQSTTSASALEHAKVQDRKTRGGTEMPRRRGRKPVSVTPTSLPSATVKSDPGPERETLSSFPTASCPDPLPGPTVKVISNEEDQTLPAIPVLPASSGTDKKDLGVKMEPVPHNSVAPVPVSCPATSIVSGISVTMHQVGVPITPSSQIDSSFPLGALGSQSVLVSPAVAKQPAGRGRGRQTVVEGQAPRRRGRKPLLRAPVSADLAVQNPQLNEQPLTRGRGRKAIGTRRKRENEALEVKNITLGQAADFQTSNSWDGEDLRSTQLLDFSTANKKQKNVLTTRDDAAKFSGEPETEVVDTKACENDGSVLEKTLGSKPSVIDTGNSENAIKGRKSEVLTSGGLPDQSSKSIEQSDFSSQDKQLYELSASEGVVKSAEKFDNQIKKAEAEGQKDESVLDKALVLKLEMIDDQTSEAKSLFISSTELAKVSSALEVMNVEVQASGLHSSGGLANQASQQDEALRYNTQIKVQESLAKSAGDETDKKCAKAQSVLNMALMYMTEEVDNRSSDEMELPALSTSEMEVAESKLTSIANVQASAIQTSDDSMDRDPMSAGQADFPAQNKQQKGSPKSDGSSDCPEKSDIKIENPDGKACDNDESVLGKAFVSMPEMADNEILVIKAPATLEISASNLEVTNVTAEQAYEVQISDDIGTLDLKLTSQSDHCAEKELNSLSASDGETKSMDKTDNQMEKEDSQSLKEKTISVLSESESKTVSSGLDMRNVIEMHTSEVHISGGLAGQVSESAGRSDHTTADVNMLQNSLSTAEGAVKSLYSNVSGEKGNNNVVMYGMGDYRDSVALKKVGLAPEVADNQILALKVSNLSTNVVATAALEEQSVIEVQPSEVQTSDSVADQNPRLDEQSDVSAQTEQQKHQSPSDGMGKSTIEFGNQMEIADLKTETGIDIEAEQRDSILGKARASETEVATDHWVLGKVLPAFSNFEHGGSGLKQILTVEMQASEAETCHDMADNHSGNANAKVLVNDECTSTDDKVKSPDVCDVPTRNMDAMSMENDECGTSNEATGGLSNSDEQIGIVCTEPNENGNSDYQIDNVDAEREENDECRTHDNAAKCMYNSNNLIGNIGAETQENDGYNLDSAFSPEEVSDSRSSEQKAILSEMEASDLEMASAVSALTPSSEVQTTDSFADQDSILARVPVFSAQNRLDNVLASGDDVDKSFDESENQVEKNDADTGHDEAFASKHEMIDEQIPVRKEPPVLFMLEKGASAVNMKDAIAVEASEDQSLHGSASLHPKSSGQSDFSDQSPVNRGIQSENVHTKAQDNESALLEALVLKTEVADDRNHEDKALTIPSTLERGDSTRQDVTAVEEQMSEVQNPGLDFKSDMQSESPAEVEQQMSLSTGDIPTKSPDNIDTLVGTVDERIQDTDLVLGETLALKPMVIDDLRPEAAASALPAPKSGSSAFKVADTEIQGSEVQMEGLAISSTAERGDPAPEDVVGVPAPEDQRPPGLGGLLSKSTLQPALPSEIEHETSLSDVDVPARSPDNSEALVEKINVRIEKSDTFLGEVLFPELMVAVDPRPEEDIPLLLIPDTGGSALEVTNAEMQACEIHEFGIGLAISSTPERGDSTLEVVESAEVQASDIRKPNAFGGSDSKSTMPLESSAEMEQQMNLSVSTSDCPPKSPDMSDTLTEKVDVKNDENDLTPEENLASKLGASDQEESPMLLKGAALEMTDVEIQASKTQMADIFANRDSKSAGKLDVCSQNDLQTGPSTIGVAVKSPDTSDMQRENQDAEVH